MIDYATKANEARKTALRLIYNAQTSHIGSCFSCADILAVLFEKMDLKKDKVVLSCGWKAAIFYHFLAEKGFFPKEDLETFCKEVECPDCPCLCTVENSIAGNRYTNNCIRHSPSSPPCNTCKDTKKVQSKFIGLCEPSVNGINYSGGSMGHGLPAAVGYALSKKLKGEEGNVYALMSDGEMAIGTTWESAAIAAHHGLDNLVVIVDRNGFQAMGETKEILTIEPLRDKWIYFGWNVCTIDGHSFASIESGIWGTKLGELDEFRKFTESPSIIFANTIKGKGVSFMEGENEWHYRAPNKEHYEAALKELA